MFNAIPISTNRYHYTFRSIVVKYCVNLPNIHLIQVKHYALLLYHTT